MRILMAHNFYQQPGGEDQVFAAESRLLEERGHTVFRLTRDFADLSRMTRANVAVRSVWNSEVYREVTKVIAGENIHVAHFHNTFPLLSPAAYYAARAAKVPVVQSLHNYRLLCPNALFYRDGRVCEDCLGKSIPWPAVMHSCYRGSRAQSAALAGMLTFHRTARTWTRAVDLYIALTEFSRNKFVEGGLPADKIWVKPNFMVSDPGMGAGEGGYALFVGRLTRDKGVEVLLEAWRDHGCAFPLKIAGDGPLLNTLVSGNTNTSSNIEVLGAQSRKQVIDLMKAARVLIVPSLWYEGFPMTIVEAYACGLPVVASDLGSLSSLVEDGVTGLHFKAGDAQDLARAIARVQDPAADLSSMRKRARQVFEERYSAEPAYKSLMSAYQAAMENCPN